MTVTAADLSERWFIGLAQAEKTIWSTTQATTIRNPTSCKAVLCRQDV